MMENIDLNDNNNQEDEIKGQIHGLFVRYTDDGIDESIHAALQNKKRVHYKCMDVISNLLAFGTSVGAIYLFRLSSVTHSSCKLALVIPCDQGPIDVIKFVPGYNQQIPNSLLVVIGTSRGSIVIFQLNLDEQSVSAQEIYKTEEFTRSEYESSIGIKMIEYDQDLFDPGQPFTKLYICDQKNRIFVLEQSSIYPAFRLLYSNKPAHILSVDESTIHQIHVHRSQLLLSTDEKTRLFSEHSNELITIGKKQRKAKGFFGACFYNVNFKPARLQPPSALMGGQGRLSSSQQTMYSSTASLVELENLLIFVSRPKFSLWQVNSRRDVMFTHMFEDSIKEAAKTDNKIIKLFNEPIQDVNEKQSPEAVLVEDDHSSIREAFEVSRESNEQSDGEDQKPQTVERLPKSDHFEKLIPIFSTTLGNLLLSHTRYEIFVIDPIGARLIVRHEYEKPIQHVCCNENEIFVMLDMGKRQTQVERIILLAPTQFVLELHRLNRFLSLMVFVHLFKAQFKRLMALPLSGPGVISTEGGLLRNIAWSTWREVSEKLAQDSDAQFEFRDEFKEIVDEIIEESVQLKQSVENLNDSRLFFTASHENIERLCSEPYASMVSLDISLANLHTNHVVHFSREALNRHKSLAKLSQSIMNISQIQRSNSTRTSLLDLTAKKNGELPLADLNNKRVIVEPLRPKTHNNSLNINKADRALQRGQSLNKIDEVLNPSDEAARGEEVSVNTRLELETRDELIKQPASKLAAEHEKVTTAQPPADDGRNNDHDPTRCPECKWPRPKAHLKPMHHSQQIQYGWLQENLMPNFEENIDQIEERAFKHGLWHVVLRCLAFRNKLEDYVRCCLMLDDVRLLNAKRIIITRCGEDELIDLVFKQLEQKLDFLEKHQDSSKSICLKCGHEIDSHGNRSDDSDDSESLIDEDENEDDISFNLVGLFKKLLRKSTDMKRAVHMLLQHPKLLDKSKIPATFYLEALSHCPRPHRVGTT